MRRKKIRIQHLLEKIMTENFSNLVKEKNTQVEEVQRVSNKMNPKRPKPRHFIIKMTTVKDKEGTIKKEKKNFKSTKTKAVIYLQKCSHKTVG